MNSVSDSGGEETPRQPETNPAKASAPAENRPPLRRRPRRPSGRRGRHFSRPSSGPEGGAAAVPSSAGGDAQPEANGSAIRQAIRELEEIKRSLQHVAKELERAASLLEQAEREKSGTEPEISALRKSVQSLRGSGGGED